MFCGMGRGHLCRFVVVVVVVESRIDLDFETQEVVELLFAVVVVVDLVIDSIDYRGHCSHLDCCYCILVTQNVSVV